jgi:hypothetical protein
LNNIKLRDLKIHLYVPLVVSTSRSFPHAWLITGFVTRLIQVSLVEQELLTLPEHLRSPRIFSGVRVILSLGLCVCFVDRCLSFCTFSFGYCVVCSSRYGFWLPLWYLQTLLKNWSEEWNIFVVICDRYSITVNQFMVATVKLSKRWLQLNVKLKDLKTFNSRGVCSSDHLYYSIPFCSWKYLKPLMQEKFEDIRSVVRGQMTQFVKRKRTKRQTMVNKPLCR